MLNALQTHLSRLAIVVGIGLVAWGYSREEIAYPRPGDEGAAIATYRPIEATDLMALGAMLAVGGYLYSGKER